MAFRALARGSSAARGSPIASSPTPYVRLTPGSLGFSAANSRYKGSALSQSRRPAWRLASWRPQLEVLRALGQESFQDELGLSALARPYQRHHEVSPILNGRKPREWRLGIGLGRVFPRRRVLEYSYQALVEAWLRTYWLGLPIILITVSALLFVGVRLALRHYGRS